MSHVLLVDDDEALRNVLSNILQRAGYSVKSLESGKEAVEASYEEFFNLALIDIHLPDMKGLELLTKLRKTEPEIIKIIITGQASLDTAIEATNKGADGYVVKPFEPKKLLEMIKLKLSKQRQNIEFDEKKVAEYIESRYQWMTTAGGIQKRR